MEIKHLQYFIKVTKAGSFTRAADDLYITQPAISRMIKSLEDEMGVPLFIRSRKKLQLTDAGRVFYEHAVKMDGQFKELQASLDSLTDQNKGHIRIGLPSIIDSVFFSSLIASFHREYPHITFELIEDGSKGIEEKVMEEKLDFGVAFLSSPHPVFDSYSLGREKLKLIVPAKHRLASRKSVRLEEVKDEEFIMFNKDFALRDCIYSACREAHFEPRIISETSQLDFIEEMVASNMGVTLLPESTIKGLSGNVKELPISHPQIEWHLSIIWKRDRNAAHVKKEFIRFAETCFIKEK
ncbi:LysR family transcriptional regulator [Jeotgalibacillus proteolyticus]|uniref:LysR family transcriptional regulator n=1 Tax=Jeotgalibacillus proteolyticus TaxID=2082395 RepID=A0A2S5GDG3_9BACL|nr:LysR family transcriptional regulator [Jeotgalibacillus proteolyticus]PPA71077.1 LysR family transcriptional regulator [Jeotgalibacillus proteolyticus]